MNNIPIQKTVPSMTNGKKQVVIKTAEVDGNIYSADVVVVFGDVKGNITNCSNVVIMDKVKGNIVRCDKVLGTLKPTKIPKGSYWDDYLKGDV